MTIYVFTGPTLSAADAASVLGATYLPPVAQGDLYRVARARPEAIGVIDGYFDTLPAVWHKEILWALSEGIAVFGSASIGALRAAELAAFGMIGVGEVFASFRDGSLEDDDEVALAHEPASAGYRALSVPLVNIRATFGAAASSAIIRDATRDALVARAKALFYPDRTYRRILEGARAAGVASAEIDALEAWLPTQPRDVKRDDALAMLRRIGAHVAAKEKTAPRFHFERTTYWESLEESCDDGAASAAAEPSAASPWQDLLDELRLDETAFEELRLRAQRRALARLLGEREGRHLEGERLARAAADFRREHDLLEADALAPWLEARDLGEDDLRRLLEEDAVLAWALRGADVDRRVVEELKLGDGYADRRARANDKRAVLAAAGLAEPAPSDAGMTRDELIAWYFRDVVHAEVPRDLRRYVRELGFGDDDQLFLRAVLREHLYQKLARVRDRR